MVIHILHTPEIMVISSDNKLMKDPEFEEHYIDHEVIEVESSASDSSFDSGKEPEGESDSDYNPSRDH